jgi:hypothetical protein
MIDIDNLQNTWLKHEEKLQKSINLNLELLRRVNVKSARSKMTGLVWINALTLLFYQIVMWYFVFYTLTRWPAVQFIISGLLLVLWSGIISYGAVKQLKLILEIDYARPVTLVQKQLQKVKIAIVHFLRMALMILPFHMVFIVVINDILFSVNIIKDADPVWMIVQTLVLIFPTIWIYRNLSPKNVNKKWVNWLLQGNGSQINEAQNFIQEIEEFELGTL